MNVTKRAHGDDRMTHTVPTSARAGPNADTDGVVGPLIEYGEQAAANSAQVSSLIGRF